MGMHVCRRHAQTHTPQKAAPLFCFVLLGMELLFLEWKHRCENVSHELS